MEASRAGGLGPQGIAVIDKREVLETSQQTSLTPRYPIELTPSGPQSIQKIARAKTGHLLARRTVGVLLSPTSPSR